ncbi:MAG: insulinase family protein [Bryobacteraceae bacterium]|nr:insulinase family protein [Bryobacteraceae bacterium]MCX7602558.1 insulinase family protein [Bryobacteraceae bacterium]
MRAALLTLMIVTAMSNEAQVTRKAAPPPPAPPRPYEFPRAASRTLANGLRVFVVEDRRLPLVAASMQLLAGHAYAPPEKAGLAMMTAGLLREGTKTRSSQEIARAVDGAGGRLEANAGNDVATVSMTFLKSSADVGFELMADIVMNPAFAEEEIERQRQQALSGLQVQYASAQYLAGAAAARNILGTHPYAWPGDGTPDTVAALRREDLVSFYERWYAPNRAWLVIAGDLSAEEGFAQAEKWFGGWKKQGPADEPLPGAPEPQARVLVIDMPTENQTQIAVGQPGVPRNHPDYIALQIGNQIFGGSFNSRLNMKLRANEGLTYGASSYFEPSRFAGIFEASTFTRTEKTADAIRMLVELLKEFRENPATDEEFAEAKAFLSGSFAIATETAASVASRVLTAEVHGLGSGYWQKYRERLERTTRAEVEQAVRRFLRPEQLSITAVGNAKEFAKALEAFGPVRVIPAAELDLASPEMVKPKK